MEYERLSEHAVWAALEDQESEHPIAMEVQRRAEILVQQAKAHIAQGQSPEFFLRESFFVAGIDRVALLVAREHMNREWDGGE